MPSSDHAAENFQQPDTLLEGAPEILHADLTGAPSPFEAATDAWVARQRVQIGLPEITPGPVAAGASEVSPAAGGGLILTDGTFETTFRDYHRDPWHGIDVHQAQVWDFPRPGIAESCGAPCRAVKGCGCEIKVVRDHCDNLSCAHPYCEQTNRDRRARDIFDRIELARRGRPVIYTVFTVPPSRREAAADMKTWKRWLRNLIAYLKKDFDLEYAVERSDPAGEDGQRWHPHSNLAWIRRSGKGFLTPEELEAIKARWKKILGLKPEDAISVHTSYTRHEKKIRFICRYLGRPWPRWAKGQKYLLRVKWFGRPPKVEKEKGAGICPKCGLDVVCMQLGSEEAAIALAARGYDNLLAESKDRQRHFARSRPAKFSKFTARVGPGGTEWIPERRPS